MIPRKNLVTLLLFALCGTSALVTAKVEVSKTDTEPSSQKDVKSDKNIKDNTSDKKESAGKKITLSEGLKWAGLPIFVVVLGVFFYEVKQGQKPLSNLERYQVFIQSGARANDQAHLAWGGRLMNDKSISAALSKFIADPKAVDANRIPLKNDDFVDMLVAFLLKEKIDITHITPTESSLSGLKPFVSNSTAIAPINGAFLFAQSYYLLKILVGEGEAQNIGNAKNNKLLADLVELHSANNLAENDLAPANQGTQKNTIPSIKVLLNLYKGDPSVELQFGTGIFKDKISIVAAAAAKSNAAKITIQKNNGIWQVEANVAT